MTKKDCVGEFATEKQKVKSLEKVIYGNGQDGLIRKVGVIEDAIIVIKSYNHIKTWILGVTVGVLALIVGSMATYIWTKILGG